MPEQSVPQTNELLSQLYKLLLDVVLPTLQGIQTTQKEQQLQAEWLSSGIEEFRSEMKLRFLDLHAELVANRAQIDDAMAALREERALTVHTGTGKTIIH